MRQTSTARVFLSSRPGDQARATLAGFVFAVVSVGFAIEAFPRTRRHLLWFCDVVAPAIPGTPTPERIVSTVDFVDRSLLGERTCLMRSLTAEALLRLYGFTPDHRIGVTKETDTEMKAHSWLELDGNVLIGELDDLAKYTPLPSLRMWDQL